MGYRGDALVVDASIVIDRQLYFAAPRTQVWPWLVQLGKARAGWYFPRGLEHLIPRRRRGSWQVLPQFQGLAVGTDVPDWGPGDPVFRVMEFDPERALVYLSLRDRGAGHRWPDGDRRGPGVLALSWALLLDDAPDNGTRVHIRLRIAPSGSRGHTLIKVVGGAFDWLTIVGLRAGLAQRIAAQGTGWCQDS